MMTQKTKEELVDDLITEVQALGINIGSLLNTIKLLLVGILILGIIALAHFW
jgi:hypothetical protein